MEKVLGETDFLAILASNVQYKTKEENVKHKTWSWLSVYIWGKLNVFIHLFARLFLLITRYRCLIREL